MNKVILNMDQVLQLVKTFQNGHKSKDMNDYEHGVVDAIDFLFFLYKVCEK